MADKDLKLERLSISYGDGGDDNSQEAIDILMDASAEAMEEVSISAETSTSEIVSAQIQLLDKTLRGMRKLQHPTDRAANAQEIHRVLMDLDADFGHIPS